MKNMELLFPQLEPLLKASERVRMSRLRHPLYQGQQQSWRVQNHLFLHPRPPLRQRLPADPVVQVDARPLPGLK